MAIYTRCFLVVNPKVLIRVGNFGILITHPFFLCCHLCRMVLKSIGYKSVPVNGLPFDHQKGQKRMHFSFQLLVVSLI